MRKSRRNDKFVEYGSVSLNTINQKVDVHNTILSWRVPNYPRLKLGVIYYQMFQSIDVKCVFKFFLSPSTMYLCLRSAKIAGKTAQFYLLNEVDHASVSTVATEIKKGLFVGEFKRDQFEDMNYVREGVVTASFRYVSDQVSSFKESPVDSADVLSDLDELCCDLKHMYLEALHSDFQIHADVYTFKAHKFVLAARCKLYQEMFEANKDANEHTVSALPGILHEVLLYVYSGELKDMDMMCMMSVYGVAEQLLVESLIGKCMCYFKENISEGNVEIFRNFAIQNGAPKLKIALDDYLGKRTTTTSA